MSKESKNGVLDKVLKWFQWFRNYFAFLFAGYMIFVVLILPVFVTSLDIVTRLYICAMALALTLIYDLLKKIYSESTYSPAEFQLSRGRIGYYDQLRERILSQKNCHLLIYANSFKRIWSGLFHPLFREYDGEVSNLNQIQMTVIRRDQGEERNKAMINEIVDDLVSFDKNEKFDISTLIGRFDLYHSCEDPCFTGISINDKYLRLRFINKKKTGDDLIKECRKERGGIDVEMIKWYLSICADASSSEEKPIDILSQVKERKIRQN